MSTDTALWPGLTNAVARAADATPEAHAALTDMLDQVEALEAVDKLTDDDIRSAIRWAGYLAGDGAMDRLAWCSLRWRPCAPFGPFPRLTDVYERMCIPAHPLRIGKLAARLLEAEKRKRIREDGGIPSLADWPENLR